jgi:chromosome segregation protein
MQIKRLKLSGFKSFVDQTELRIEPGLTGIVGPNGCGKSNLLEAIRWVMGESSAKSMRGGGMEDVIFAGTSTRPQRDFAEVSLLTVQEQGELFNAVEVGADGELEVTRRIERGAGSAYRANGRDVRAKDVALIFADAATGPHSPALVSQGRIAAVIAARPQERRAMLEEAAGISGLHVRRKDAEQKLRAAEANLVRLDEILSDMEARASNLRRQAKAAERYIKLSEQIRVAEGRVIFARWREAASSADAARKEAADAESAVSAAQEAQAAAAAHANAAVDALAARRVAAQVARDEANEAGHRLTTLRTERDGVVRRLHDLAQQAERLEEDRAREGTLANDAAEAIARLTDPTSPGASHARKMPRATRSWTLPRRWRGRLENRQSCALPRPRWWPHRPGWNGRNAKWPSWKAKRTDYPTPRRWRQNGPKQGQHRNSRAWNGTLPSWRSLPRKRRGK